MDRVPTWTGCVVYQSELQQGAEDERQTDAGPHVDGLGVGHGRKWRVDTGSLRCHGEQRGDAERYAGRHRALIEPEGHPGHDDQHAAGNVDLDQVVRELSLEQEIHLETTVFTWRRDTNRA